MKKKDELRQEVSQIWNKLTGDEISPWTGSMSRRVNSIIESDGGHSRY